MGVIEYIILVFSSYPILVSFLGGFLVGEEGILALGVLSGQGVLDWRIVLLFSYLGLMAIDTIWFFVGRIKRLSVLKKNRFVYRSYERAIDFMNHFSRGNDFLLMMFSKFVSGSRVAVVMYMGRRRLSFHKFLLYNSVVVFIWSCLAVLVGFGAGRGISLFMNVYNGFITAATGLVVIVISFLILRHFISNMLFRKIKLKERLNKKLNKRLLLGSVSPIENKIV